MINAKTEIYGIIGYPLKHSLSPLLHTNLFKFYSINAIYTAFETNNITNAIKGLRALGIKGVNITVPYKEAVLDSIDEIDENAKNLKAVNTIKNISGKLVGFNTDYLGFIDMFKNHIKDIQNIKLITVIGAGGAAKAIIYALYQLDIKHIFLLNRTLDNAIKTKNIFKDMINIDISDLNDKDILSSSDIIVNCTSVGLNTQETPININYVDKAIIMDIIYKDSLLTKQARSKNLKAINGMDMFIGQALHTFKIFTGKNANKKIAYSIIKGDFE